MSQPELSAILVAWNSGRSLGECIESLRSSAKAAGAAIEIVLVDNGSTDGSVEDASLDARDVLVRNGVNAGYGVAAAQGLALATSPWLLLINPDIVVAPEFVPAMLEATRDVASNMCSLVPDMRYQSNPMLVNSRGLTVDRIGVPAELDAGTSVDVGNLHATEVFGGSSGCCLLRADAVRAVGGLEPGYFAYFEDVDLAWRLQRVGLKARLVPRAIVFHEGSASTGEGSPLKTYLVARNRRLTFRINGPRTLRARIARVPVEVGHALYSLSRGSLASLSGRHDAFRLRSYATFVRRSRALVDGGSSEPPFSRQLGLLETLHRKRTIVGTVRQHDGRERPVASSLRRATRASLSGSPIVCLGFADWDAEAPTNQHHLMARLASESPVLFIESLGLRRPTASSRDVDRMVRRFARGLRPLRRDADLNVLSPLVVPYHGTRLVRRLNERLLRRVVARATRTLGFDAPILWTYVPQALALVETLNPRLIVYHCVDDIGAHDRIDAASFRQLEEALVRKADLVIASAQPIHARLVQFSENVRLMTNVADTDAFAAALGPGPTDPMVQALPRPRILFVGSLSALKVDFQLICELARLRRDWSIVLVGPIGLGDPLTDVTKLQMEPNVHILGPRLHDELPAVLRGADAGIIPYHVNRLTSSVFPMKVYEYLAAGLPTVSTPLPALAGVDGISFAADAVAMCAQLERLLAEDSDLLRRDRSRLASAHSWAARMAEIEEAVGELQWRR